MSDVTYLKFDSIEIAANALESNGFSVSQYKDKCQELNGVGWGCLFYIDEQNGYFCNIYDYDKTALDGYKIKAPSNPVNVRY